MEDFVDGLVVTYDGIVDRAGEVIFAASTRYDQSVMEVVNLLSLKLGRCTNYTVYRCFLPKWRTLSRAGGEAASCYERAKHRFLNQAFYGPPL